jgi:tetrahydromethanopterin S-methyltransferase subunit D
LAQPKFQFAASTAVIAAVIAAIIAAIISTIITCFEEYKKN